MQRTFIFFISLMLLMTGCVPEPSYPKSTFTHSITSPSAEIKLLWSLDNVYVGQNDFQPMMSASSGVVCFLGDNTYPPKLSTSCFDSKTGSKIWQEGFGSPNGIITNTDGVYIFGGNEVDKFSLDGKLLWYKTFNSTGIHYAYLYNNQIQLLMVPERFLVLDKDTGEKISENKKERIIFISETEKFVTNYSIESRSPDLKKINWQLDIPSNLTELEPFFTKEDFILIRTGRVKGKLVAIDRTTGEIRWKTETDISSNIAYHSDQQEIYALDENGKLLKIGESSGKQTELLQFSNTPFVYNGEAIVGGYEIALDTNNNILFLLLGDSRQLFAFQLQ